jgi:hypothetical protein
MSYAVHPDQMTIDFWHCVGSGRPGRNTHRRSYGPDHADCVECGAQVIINADDTLVAHRAAR